MKRVVAAFARNTVFANILLVLIFLAGIIATIGMIRETFPEMSLDAILITVPYPGADPEEVEEGISRKIEEAIEEVEGIKQYNTIAAENVGSAWIEIHEDYDTPVVLDRVRSKIDSISTFPVDAEKPVIKEFIIDDPVMVLGLAGEMPERRLKEWAEEVKEEIQRLPEVSQLHVSGVRNYEISIELSEEQLREYGLTFAQVANTVRQSSLNMAGGTIRTQGEEIRVRTVGRKYTGSQFASIVVLATPRGDVITLDRVASIRDTFTEDPHAATLNGDPMLFLAVNKTGQEDAITISEAVHAFVAAKQRELPAGVTMSVLYDLSDLIRARIRLLVKNGIIGLTIVFLLLAMFLDARLSFWAGMGIPISVAGALAVLWAIGGSINMVSLFGLIMVLGIIVDDAIVVGEAIYVHRQSGMPPLRAAVEGVCEVGMPVIAAVLTTVVAFVPLAYIGGIMGKFIRVLPVVVIASLTVSLIECLVLLPAHLGHLPHPADLDRSPNRFKRRVLGAHRHANRRLERFVDHIYMPTLGKSLASPYVAFCAAIAILLLTLGLMRSGLVKFQVFPQIDGFIVTSTVEFPNGTPADITADAIQKIEQGFERVAARTTTKSGEPLAKSYLTIVGETLEHIPKYGPNVGSVSVVLLEAEQRGIHSDRLLLDWEKEVDQIPGVESLSYHGLQAGPPGAPIEVWLQGRDMDIILEATADLRARLERFDGVHQVQSDFSPGKNELRLRLKPEARTLGLTVAGLATQVHAGYYGEEALRLQRGRDDIRVKVRYPFDERTSIADFQCIRIRTPGGHEIPLSAVADMHFAPGYSSIQRTDGLRRVMVSAEVDSAKANTTEILAELEGDYFEQLRGMYPDVYISVQGEQKKSRESFGSLKIGFPMALLGIFIIIATIFRSYVQPLIIMFTVPFGIIGAVIGHLVMGYNLSMISMFGFVALSGVVVNDAIVLIEAVNANLAAGMPFFEAVKNGGKRRFRAVFLTTISTIGGLTPMILEKDLQARVMIPMAISIAAGVAFATVLTLLLIPSLLVILNDLRRALRRMTTGVQPTREEVEPATYRAVDPLLEKDVAIDE